LQIEMPTVALNRLIVLYKANAPIIQDLGIQEVRIIHRRSHETAAPVSKGESRNTILPPADTDVAGPNDQTSLALRWQKAALGYQRPGVAPFMADLEQMEFCYVPPGPFWMGSEESFEDGYSQHLNDRLNYGYWIARCPVTIAQFRAFVQDQDNQSPEYRVRGLDERSWRGPDNSPVAWVTWDEALIFCYWLTMRWHGLLPKGYQVTLPSEAEWEKAARGGLMIPVTPIITRAGDGFSIPTGQLLKENPNPKRRYPWGDELDPSRANYQDTDIGLPSEVGRFPTGVSPYGCLDMAGNVWEWTRSLDRPYPYRPDEREDLRALENWGRRVLRGGSFASSEWEVRCSSRTIGFQLRSRDRGWRLAVPIPIF
jgi:formylglycine-generating enzyme required for sulfatase activity